jgi:hypothetical protein
LRVLVSIAALTAGVSCAEENEFGLRVEALDATFGLARVGAARSDAGAGLSSSASPAVASGSLPPDGMENPPAAAGDAQVDGDAAVIGMADAGPPARNCRNVASFTQNALPALIERCVRCHDGTKSKATKVTDFTLARDMSPAAQQSTCREALKAAPDTSEKSPLFAEVNPGDTMTVHDFKYPSMATYMAYRSAVLVWLETESAP